MTETFKCEICNKEDLLENAHNEDWCEECNDNYGYCDKCGNLHLYSEMDMTNGCICKDCK